jgi:hypothetical protein
MKARLLDGDRIQLEILPSHPKHRLLYAAMHGQPVNGIKPPNDGLKSPANHAENKLLTRDEFNYRDKDDDEITCGNCLFQKGHACLFFKRLTETLYDVYDLDPQVSAAHVCDAWQEHVTDAEAKKEIDLYQRDLGRDLAWHYAEMLNDAADAQGMIDFQAYQSVLDDLADSDWTVEMDDGTFAAAMKPDTFEVAHYGKRAPAGYTKQKPLVVNGKPFVGGQWIPDADLENATPEQKKLIEDSDTGRKAKKEEKLSGWRKKPVDVKGFKERLSEKQPLQEGELASAKRAFGTLKGYHKEYVVHRLEEVEGQSRKSISWVNRRLANVEKRLASTPDDAKLLEQRDWLGGIRDRQEKQLARVKHMLEWAEESGLTGKVDEKEETGAVLGQEAAGDNLGGEEAPTDKAPERPVRDLQVHGDSGEVDAKPDATEAAFFEPREQQGGLFTHKTKALVPDKAGGTFSEPGEAFRDISGKVQHPKSAPTDVENRAVPPEESPLLPKEEPVIPEGASDDERSRIELAHVADRVAEDPEKASEQDLRRALHWQGKRETHFRGVGNHDAADAASRELGYYKQILKQRELASKEEPKPEPGVKGILKRAKERKAKVPKAEAAPSEPPKPEPMPGAARVTQPSVGERAQAIRDKRLQAGKEEGAWKRKFTSQGKKDLQAHWHKEAQDAGIEPAELEWVAKDMRRVAKEQDSHVQGMLSDARQMAPKMGDDFASIPSIVRRGGDYTEMRGFDDIAKSMQARYPELLPEENASQGLWELLVKGNPKQDDDKAYRMAFDYLWGKEKVPFGRDLEVWVYQRLREELQYGSYFGECERDEGGQCLPKGVAGQPAKKDPRVESPVISASPEAIAKARGEQPAQSHAPQQIQQPSEQHEQAALAIVNAVAQNPFQSSVSPSALAQKTGLPPEGVRQLQEKLFRDGKIDFVPYTQADATIPAQDRPYMLAITDAARPGELLPVMPAVRGRGPITVERIGPGQKLVAKFPT